MLTRMIVRKRLSVSNKHCIYSLSPNHINTYIHFTEADVSCMNKPLRNPFLTSTPTATTHKGMIQYTPTRSEKTLVFSHCNKSDAIDFKYLILVVRSGCYPHRFQ